MPIRRQAANNGKQPPPRKIVQIAVATAGDGGEQWPVLHALCDDGTVWLKSLPSSRWEKVGDVPRELT